MNDLSRLANMAEIVGALVVVGGLAFAIMQMRNFRQQRREVAAMREQTDSPAAFEWFQWLAERFDELHDPESPPAFVAHKAWRPTRLSKEI